MVAYTHLMEFVPDRESLISGIFLFIDGLVFVVSPLILVYVTNDTDFFLLIAASLCCISLLLFAIIRVPESLKFLLSMNKYDEFWHNFKVIARYNHVTNEDISVLKKMIKVCEDYQASRMGKSMGRKDGTIEILKKQKDCKVIVFNLCMMLLAWIAMSFGINLLNFYTKHLPGEVYNNSMWIGMAAFAFILAGPLSIRF
jgi:hypothetical protein